MRILLFFIILFYFTQIGSCLLVILTNLENNNFIKSKKAFRMIFIPYVWIYLILRTLVKHYKSLP